ncbi:MAG: hypothetical protein JXQ80_05960 [Bacteroidales bacterium]|nr:hypothetical protein [Bacteroidales bacterium]
MLTHRHSFPDVSKTLLTLVVFIAVSGLVYGQAGPVTGDYSTGQLVQYTNQIFGFDDLLVNGSVYRPEKPNALGNPFFECPYAEESGIFIKGQHFANIKLLYDIAGDQLLLLQPLNKEVSRYVLLRPELVDSFEIGNCTFVNPSNFDNVPNVPGYYEKIAGKEVLFLKKHKKSFIKIYDTENKGKYSNQQSINYILDQRGLTNVTLFRWFLSYHGPYKKEIRTYLKEKKIKYRKASPDEIRKLMKFCYELNVPNS